MSGQDFIPYVEGESGPPGYVLAQDQDSRMWWINPNAVQKGDVVSELTPWQIERVRAFKQILFEHDKTTLAEAVNNFSRDGHPDVEIRCWEEIARVYAEELRDRSEADATERALLFRAVLACSFSTRIEDLLGSQPRLKTFPDLARVIQRFGSAGAA